MAQITDLVPTAKLRWVAREGARIYASLPNYVLQVWWAQDMPGYMRDHVQGEWRDVPQVEESP